MTRKIAIFVLIAAAVGCKTNSNVNARVETLATTQDSLSYALGVSIGENLKMQGINDINASVLAQGMKDQLDSASMMDPMTADSFVRSELTRLKEEKDASLKQAGVDFLEQNKSKEGVNTTETGLQYKVMTEGTGLTPDANDEVTVHYEGRLIDGSVFDSSYERGQPATFRLNQVIPGWTEGLQLMKAGGKTQFYIPQNLGYGARPAPGGKIPAYSTLVFDVELISVNPMD
ncbi:MAG: hypothetical protein RL226_952 [Bacteroidota bacterium]|jgi:FKBP-type peptidyl-prolyl cis-trans isomerase